MINVSFGPNMFLSGILLFGIVLLYGLRNVKPEVSRDEDLFFVTAGFLYCGILMVHGWRLDPILLFSQALIIPVEISVYEDRSYTFILKTPPASVLLANAAKIKKGSSTPNKITVGSITKAQLEEIAQTKLPDLNTRKISSAMKIVEGTARNMGISIAD